MDASRIALYARTLSHLRMRQIVYLALREIGSRPRRLAGKTPQVRLRDGVRIQPPLVKAMLTEHVEFRFLNVSKTFDHRAIDWVSADMSRLWRYNLHYFDYILDPGRSVEQVAYLISDWIRSNPVGQGVGWEPYPTSLRIANWIKLFLRESFASHVQTTWRESLYMQSLWLERNIEHHLLANHLLKNGKALLFAGVYFSGGDADRWLRKGSRILVEEAHEQILGDGGHFERSPMYHSIVVEDYLDAVNLMTSCRGCVVRDKADALATKTRAALDFLSDMCQPEGRIPLFNDSAFGIAPEPNSLLEYARRVIDYRPPTRPPGLSVSSHDPTGYYVIRNGGDKLVVDCGDVGPSYQPGHAHCDTLSFELTTDGRALVVDSGVYDYADTEMRHYVRSTRAHNTATIDDCEQSELWGVFRVARRARPLGATVEKLGESRARFSGGHDGFVGLSGSPVHTRSIEYETSGIWTVVDSFEGRGEHRLDTFVHLHPDLVVRLAGRTALAVSRDGDVVAKIQALDSAVMALEKGWYCPEFGKKQENVVIRLSSSGPLPRKLGYRIAKPVPEGDRKNA